MTQAIAISDAISDDAISSTGGWYRFRRGWVSNYYQVGLTACEYQ